MAQELFVNGKRVILPDGITTVAQARPYLGVARDDILMNVRGASAVPLKSEDRIDDNDNLASFPQITKGAGGLALSAWLQQDLDLLRASIGGRHQIETKAVMLGGQPYTAVMIRNVRMNKKKFGTVSASILFLLPGQYPALPPLGVYIHYPLPGRDHHFTLQSYYGAPDLREKGWYWYCLHRPGSGAWRPGASPADGHNLISVFTSARYAINTDC
jgi:hypothetical protein